MKPELISDTPYSTFNFKELVMFVVKAKKMEFEV